MPVSRDSSKGENNGSSYRIPQAAAAQLFGWLLPQISPQDLAKLGRWQNRRGGEGMSRARFALQENLTGKTVLQVRFSATEGRHELLAIRIRTQEYRVRWGSRSAKQLSVCSCQLSVKRGFPRLRSGQAVRLRVRMTAVERQSTFDCSYWQLGTGNWFYTPTGNGLGLRSSPRSRTRLSKRPCSSDINPVYQYPKTNSTKNGTVMKFSLAIAYQTVKAK